MKLLRKKCTKCEQTTRAKSRETRCKRIVVRMGKSFYCYGPLVPFPVPLRPVQPATMTPQVRASKKLVETERAVAKLHEEMQAIASRMGRIVKQQARLAKRAKIYALVAAKTDAQIAEERAARRERALARLSKMRQRTRVIEVPDDDETSALRS